MALRYKAELGAAIKQRRESLGMTQRELADRLHVSEAQTISRWERGINMTHNLEQVAEALDLDVKELLSTIRPPTMAEARELNGSLPAPHASQLDRIESKLDQLNSNIARLLNTSQIDRETLIEMSRRTTQLHADLAGPLDQAPEVAGDTPRPQESTTEAPRARPARKRSTG